METCYDNDNFFKLDNIRKEMEAIAKKLGLGEVQDEWRILVLKNRLKKLKQLTHRFKFGI